MFGLNRWTLFLVAFVAIAGVLAVGMVVYFDRVEDLARRAAVAEFNADAARIVADDAAGVRGDFEIVYDAHVVEWADQLLDAERKGCDCGGLFGAGVDTADAKRECARGVVVGDAYGLCVAPASGSGVAGGVQ